MIRSEQCERHNTVFACKDQSESCILLKLSLARDITRQVSVSEAVRLQQSEREVGRETEWKRSGKFPPPKNWPASACRKK